MGKGKLKASHKKLKLMAYKVEFKEKFNFCK